MNVCVGKKLFSGQGTRHPLETSAAHSRVLKILQRELPEFAFVSVTEVNSKPVDVQRHIQTRVGIEETAITSHWCPSVVVCASMSA